MTDSSSTDNIIVPDPPAPINGNCTTPPQSPDDDEEDRFQTGFGCCGRRPAALQCIAGARCFLLFVCLTAFFQSMIVNGLIGVTISTIERRFALSSSQTAWIAATYEIAGAPALLIIGYLGSTLHRPAWIGGGLIMLGVGFGIFSIPHFAAPPYRYTDGSSNLCVETAWNASNASLATGNRCARCVFD